MQDDSKKRGKYNISLYCLNGTPYFIIWNINFLFLKGNTNIYYKYLIKLLQGIEN